MIMKLMKKVGLGTLAVMSCLVLASCSTAGKIQKAFEKEGYIWNVQEVSEETKANGIDGLYVVGKDGSLIKNVPHGIVVEFSTKNAEEAYQKVKEEDIFTDEALNTIIDSVSSTPVTNGNCMIFSIDSTVISIFQNA